MNRLLYILVFVLFSSDVKADQTLFRCKVVNVDTSYFKECKEEAETDLRYRLSSINREGDYCHYSEHLLDNENSIRFDYYGRGEGGCPDYLSDKYTKILTYDNSSVAIYRIITSILLDSKQGFSVLKPNIYSKIPYWKYIFLNGYNEFAKQLENIDDESIFIVAILSSPLDSVEQFNFTVYVDLLGKHWILYVKEIDGDYFVVEVLQGRK